MEVQRKKIITILISLLFSFGISQSQVPVKRNRANKSEQTNSSNPKVRREQPNKNAYNGHAYVDLGLPSGLKWATCNIGASKPSDYGNYYAWGETNTKSNYTDGNCKTFDKSESELKSSGIINSAGNLTMSYDAARSNWGGSWRMPTEQEWEELKNKCTWTWTSQGGHNGYRVTGHNGKSIFLPAAGYRYGASLYDAGEDGGYWSSPCCDDSFSAFSLYFNSSYRDVYWDNRDRGLSVRAVAE